MPVIGAGIAGLEFALCATKRGHHVTIYEKENRIGGIIFSQSEESFIDSSDF